MTLSHIPFFLYNIYLYIYNIHNYQETKVDTSYKNVNIFYNITNIWNT